MKFLHTMVRVHDLDKSLEFYIKHLGLVETRRVDVPEGKFSLIFLATEVDDIYALCTNLMAEGITINRPPRCGHMAFVKSPDNISIELLQKGPRLAPQEPWLSMENSGSW